MYFFFFFVTRRKCAPTRPLRTLLWPSAQKINGIIFHLPRNGSIPNFATYQLRVPTVVTPRLTATKSTAVSNV